MSTRILVTPLDLRSPIRIALARTASEARRLMARGFTPIECSFASESVVDDLQLDHHGALSDLEGVAIRAYRDSYGLRRDKPWFVFTGFPDEDACFAAASLAGILPHHSLASEFPDAPPAMRRVARQNLEHVALLINAVDVNPDLAITLIDSYWGRVILAWRQQAHPTAQDELAWLGGIDRWRTLLTSQTDDLINSAVEAQAERLEEVASACAQLFHDRVAVVDFSAFGPNSTFYREWLDRVPLIVAFFGGPQGVGRCSFVVRDLATAQRFYGERGLAEVYPQLIPAGCGGRETIGGSSRQLRISWEEAVEYGRMLDSLIAA